MSVHDRRWLCPTYLTRDYHFRIRKPNSTERGFKGLKEMA